MYEPNQSITIETNAIVEIDGQSVNVPVNVIFRLFPLPTVVIEADELPNLVFRKERFEISLASGARLETMVRSFNPLTCKGSLIPAFQPVNVIDKGVLLRSVQFSILNFPKFFKSQTKWCRDGETSIAIPHALVEASGWRVEITGVQNISDVVKTLKRENGYGVTYNGVITRSDEANFTAQQVEILLTALRTFFSFVRGTSCSLALIEGKDQNGDQSWVRWGAHYVAPWNSQQSWFRQHGGDDIISELFPKFWCLFESGDEWKKTLLRTIDWYLLSNESAIHAGIILTQAALERLSYQIHGREKKESARNLIRNALEKLNLEPQIPPSCPRLKNLQQTYDWADGPHALVKIRNDLVHPKTKNKLGDIAHYAHQDARNLGQWYIEMMLLRKLGYQGSYVNRLASGHKENEAILPVPWAKNHGES